MEEVIIDPDNWQIHALCRGSDVNKFFPEPGVSVKVIQAIKEMCSRCPVRWQCLDLALAQDIDQHGIFGGHTPNDRRAIRYEARRRGISVREASRLHDHESAKALNVEC